MLDKLPFYSTKEPSTLNVTAEAAVIIPGHYDAINIQSDDPDIEETSGISNIDDFEGAVTPFNLGGFNANAWTLASTPVEFKESQTENDLSYGANRARLNWYVLDLGMTRSAADNTDPYTRLIDQRELFTNRQVQPGQQQLFTFDVSYYPQERGPYNFETRNGYPGISNGFSIRDDKILLNNPVSRWGGLMRYFQNADFEAANYEFIEFWMLNPFMDRRDGEAHLAGEEGEMVFNLGSISEDIIRDNYLFFENAIPTTQRVVPTTNTAYGRATISIPLVNGFDLQEGQFQELGFDGMTDQDEQVKYQSWLVENGLTNIVDVVGDPSNDNFKFFNDPSFNNVDNLLVKMKDFNGPQGNAPLDNGNQNQFVRGNRYPDTEDLNNNKSLDQADAYYEYRIRLRNLNGELDT